MATESTASLDFVTDMQTIRNYVSAVVETKAKIATAYTAALGTVQTTFQTASPAEARPDVLGVILKSGLKTAEKSAVTAVKESTGAGLGRSWTCCTGSPMKWTVPRKQPSIAPSPIG